MAESIWERGRKTRFAKVPPTGRIDIGLLLFLATIIGGGLAAAWGFGNIEETRGFFDPPIVSEVEDRRILTDYRSETSPIVDATMIGGDAVWVRENGVVQSYDVARDLVLKDNHGLQDLGFASGPTSLTAECNSPLDGDCSQANRAFLRSDKGGLAVLKRSRWTKLLDDNGWTGLNGELVEQDDLTAWGVSQDGRWVLASAGDQGLGLFDQSKGEWQKLARNLSVFEASQIVFAHQRFWLASPDGVLTFTPENRQIERAANQTGGNVLDIDRTPDGQVMVLQTGGCKTGSNCLTVSKTTRSGELSLLAGGIATDENLSDLTVFHASLQKGSPVVLGRAGVHRYDIQTRVWITLLQTPVDAFHAASDGNTIYLAAGTDFAKLSNGIFFERKQLTSKATQIQPTATGQILVLDRDGKLFDLAGEAPKLVRPVDLGAPSGVRFTAATFWNNTLIFAGPQGSLLHNPTTRRYSFDPNGWPKWKGGDAGKLVVSAPNLWLVNEAKGQAFTAEIVGDWPNKTLQFTQQMDVEQPIQSTYAQNGGVAFLTQNGKPYIIRKSQSGRPHSIFGTTSQQLSDATHLAAVSDSLFFADNKAIQRYFLQNRGWSAPISGPSDGIADLGARGAGYENLVVMSPNGTVSAPSVSDGWQYQIGSNIDASIGLSNVSDSNVNGNILWLAGDGKVQPYYLDRSRFYPALTGGRGDVRLISVNGRPLWLSGGSLFLNDRKVSQNGETVKSAWAASGEFGYMAARSNGSNYVVGVNSDLECKFLSAAAPAGAPLDTRRLADGRLLVITDKGAGLYDPILRRWLKVTGIKPQRSSYLEVVRGHLLHVVPDGSAKRFQSVLVEKIGDSQSCSDAAVEIDWDIDEPNVDVSVDVKSGAVHLLNSKNGTVGEWQNGTIQALLPQANSSDATSSFKRVYKVNNGFTFLSETALHHYNITTRNWSRQKFVGLSIKIKELDLFVSAGEPAAVTLWDTSGAIWGADVGSGELRFSKKRLPPAPQISQPSAQISDFAQSNDQTAILGRNSIEFYSGRTFRDRKIVSFSTDTSGKTLVSIGGFGGNALISGPLQQPNTINFLPQQDKIFSGSLNSTSFAYTPENDQWWLADRAHLWRLDAQLKLYKCAFTIGGSSKTHCTQVLGNPHSLERDDVIAAEEINDKWIYQSGDGLWLLDDENRNPQRLLDPEVTNSGVLFRHSNAVLFWDRQARNLYQFEAQQSRMRLMQNDVLDVANRSDKLVLTLPNGASAWRSAVIANATQLSAVTFSKDIGTEGSAGFYGLSPQGRIFRNGKEEPNSGLLRLPSSTVAIANGPAPASLGDRNIQGWWAQDQDGTIGFYWDRACVKGDLPQVDYFDAPLRHVLAEETLRCQGAMSFDLGWSDQHRLLSVEAGRDRIEFTTTAGRFAMNPDGNFTRTGDFAGRVQVSLTAKGNFTKLISRFEGKGYVSLPQLREQAGVAAVSVAGLQISFDAPIDPAKQWEAFGNDWLAWDRNSNAIKIDGTPLAPKDAFENGILLPLTKGRGAYRGKDRFAWITASGHWLVDDATRVQVVSIGSQPDVIGLAHDRFLLRSGGLDVVTGAQSNDNDTHTIAAADLTFVEALRGQKVTATLSVGGQSVNAFSSRGFQFDTRQDITQLGTQAFLLTPVGLADAESFATMLPVPRNMSAVEGQNGTMFGKTGTSWAAWDGAQWVRSDPPRWNGIVAQESGRKWHKVSGKLLISPVVASEQWRVDRNGLRFAADTLVALGYSNGEFVTVTGVGTQVARSFSGLASLSDPIVPPNGIRSIDVQTAAPNKEILWAQTANQKLVWNSRAQSWVPPKQGQKPWEYRAPFPANAPISLSFTNGSAAATIVVEANNGTTAPSPFNWRRGGVFPFDKVNGLIVADGQVLLASDFGLRRLTGQGHASGGDVIYSNAPANAPPKAWVSIGRPASTPTVVAAKAQDGSCAEFTSARTAPTGCARNHDLRQRFVIETPFWQWVKSDRKVAGMYLNRNGTELAPVTYSSRDGFAHDRLAARVRCNGVTYEAWQGRDTIATLNGLRPVALDRVSDARELYCQSETHQLGGGQRLAPGVIAVGRDQSVQLSGQSWNSVDHKAVVERSSGLLPWNSARLKMGLKRGQPQLSYFGRDQKWHPLGWSNGTADIDKLTGVTSVSAGQYALSKEGFYPISVGGGYRINPKSFDLFGATTASTGFGECVPFVIEPNDGSVQAVPKLQNGTVTVGCRNGEFFRGSLAGSRDRAAFDVLPENPLNGRVLTSNDRWQFTLSNANKYLGHVVTSFDTEPVSLSAGRYSFDDWTGFATPFAETTEVLTSGSGWWQQSKNDFSLAALSRPVAEIDPTEVISLSSDLVEGKRSLCLTLPSQKQNIFADGQRARAGECRDWLGDDRVWSWYQNDEGASAFGTARNGVTMHRALEDGRFGDLIATGAPLVAASKALEGVLVPTRAGAVELGPNGPIAHYAFDQAVTLTLDQSGAPVFVVGARSYKPYGDADLLCPAVQALPTLLEKRAEIEKITYLPHKRIQVLVITPTERIALTMACDDVVTARPWFLGVERQHTARFMAERSNLQGPEIYLSVVENRLVASDAAEKGVEQRMELSGPMVAQIAAQDADAVLLFSSTKLLRVDLDRAVSDIARAQRSVDLPRGAFAPAPQQAEPQQTQPQQAEPETQATPKIINVRPRLRPQPTVTQPKAPTPPVPSVSNSGTSKAARKDPKFDAPQTEEPDLTMQVSVFTLPSPEIAWTKQQVRDIQSALNRKGFSAGSIDGLWGQNSNSALMSWKEKNGYSPTEGLTVAQFKRLTEVSE
ncbi:peptidoglycan-binding domain-containing protein [Thalassovita autumnalis]|uniref:peptidoglycan-binding domain-containing protein n=1 Tax=Thalassovita autumnalis TaxID=2072972 RepID=UPI00071D0D5B|nr:peptidoglycan-binding domain-containing protein [Thalassovita autumnalis]